MHESQRNAQAFNAERALQAETVMLDAVAKERDRYKAENAALRECLAEIRDLIDGMVDVEDGEDRPRPNIFMRIEMVSDRAELLKQPLQTGNSSER